MFGGKWSKTKCPIGIDVGTRSVRMLQLERRDARKGGPAAGYAVVAAALQELPDGLAPTGEPYHTAVTDAIRKMLGQSGFAGRRVVSCLPAPSVQYKNLRLPKMPPDELEAAVRWEASDRLQISRDDSAIQFFDAGEVRQGDELREEVILLAASTSAIEAHTRMLIGCGLEPLAIDVVPAALARYLTVLSPQVSAGSGDDIQARVLIDVGYQSTKVLILREERIAFFKLINVGGRTFDQAVATTLGLSVTSAASLRQDVRQSAANVAPERVEAVKAAMRPAVVDLAREIGLCLRYYSVTFRGRRPESAVLVGGEALHSGLTQELSTGAGIHVSLGSELTAIDTGAAANVIRSGPERMEWAVAAGLSLRGEPVPGERAATTAKRGVAA